MLCTLEIWKGWKQISHVSRWYQERAGSRNVDKNGGDAHHLPGSHADGLDAELPIAHVEKIFETRPQKVDDEDIVQAFLTKMVDLRDADCVMAKQMMGQPNAERNKRAHCTDDNQRGYDTSDIRLSAGELRPFGVPVCRFC